jgi:hypothetical protein
MSIRLTSDTPVTVMLQAPSPQMALAADITAQHLRISRQEALARLADAPARIASSLPVGKARRLCLLLRLLGLRVSMMPDNAHPAEVQGGYEVSLQANGADARLRLRAMLSAMPMPVASAMLDMPSGVVIEGLDWSGVVTLRRRIKSEPGLRMMISDPQSASYDVIPWGRPADPASAIALTRHLRRLGVARCALTGAVGADLDAAMRTHVLSRFPEAGVIALNRDFQRFDLILTGAPDLPQRDLADFLAARAQVPHALLARPGAAPGLRIECALTRADTLAFQADYAAIGIETRPMLVLTREGDPV